MGAKVDGEAKAPAKVAAPAAPAKKPSDGLTVDNSIPNGGYTGMINGRSKFKDATTDEMKGTWSKLNYGPYKKTTGAPDRWEKHEDASLWRCWRSKQIHQLRRFWKIDIVFK